MKMLFAAQLLSLDAARTMVAIETRCVVKLLGGLIFILFGRLYFYCHARLC